MNLNENAANSSRSPAERRKELRATVDETASLVLVRDGTTVSGRIIDLSMSGCCIRTDMRFALGIFTRVETEFRIEGLPVRLAGVIQAIHNRYTVGIRFLDMSARKQEQLKQLMEEMSEMREREKAAPIASPPVGSHGNSPASEA